MARDLNCTKLFLIKIISFFLQYNIQRIVTVDVINFELQSKTNLPLKCCLSKLAKPNDALSNNKSFCTIFRNTMNILKCRLPNNLH